MKPTFNVALIIPTGIGASIGGYGGDAMTLLPILSTICDTVITHPNVANAACFQKLPENALYVEGYGLDKFFQGDWSLSPVHTNKVGVIWDSGIPQDMERLHLNTMNAVKTVYGVSIIGVEATSEPVDLTIDLEASGRSAGKIGNPQVLLEAGQALISQGATALAVCCLMPELDDSEEDEAYKSGTGVDPIAGLEAMISHLLVSHFHIPAAHAPVFTYENALPVVDRLVDPRAASEFMVSTFLPCVLTGLSKAPQFTDSESPGVLNIQDLSALIVPADALGSLPVLSCIRRNIPVIAVQNNVTVMGCTTETLQLEGSVISTPNYMEALGYLTALKTGIEIPQHFKAQVGNTEILSVYANA